MKSHKTLIRLADKYFSIFIRKRDNGTCFTCGKVADWKEMHCGHYVLRQYLNTRWSPKNCHCQCPRCNTYLHGNLDEYAVRLKRKYGVKVLEELNHRKWDKNIIKDSEIEKLIELYRED